MIRLIRILGRKGYAFFYRRYDIFTFILSTIAELRHVYFYRRQIIEQLYRVGVQSIPLVAVISAFTGMVTSIQAAHQLIDYPFIPLYTVGAVVLQSVVLELGPVLTGLVMAGRIGAGITAEIGTMKVSEQIDALESLAIDPIGYLVMPRVLAAMMMMPVLSIFSIAIALFTSLIIAPHVVSRMTTYEFIKGMRMFFFEHDLFVGLVKAICFGMMIALIGSYKGLTTHNGAKGVGLSTTLSVVFASVAILIVDYLVAQLLL